MKIKRLITKLTACMCAASIMTAMFMMPQTAFAGQQLGQTDFDDGVGLPWHIVESQTGKMEFDLVDGAYQITIVNPGGASNGGEDRWDCQFRHRGLTIVAGHQYQVDYSITASNAGKYYTKIGNYEGTVEIWHNMSNGYDLDQTWDPIQIGANETKNVSVTFTASQSMEVAEWAFHLGGDGQYTSGGCFPAGTVITFDNMSLVDLTSNENDYVEEEKWVRSDVLTNQVGYFSNMSKKATLLSDSKSGVEFYLKNSSGETVYTGTSTVFGYDADSGDNVHVLDFTEYDGSGEGFYIETKGGAGSREFDIDGSVKYSALLYDALNYFYQNRSAIEIKSDFITSGDVNGLSRDAGHTSDVAEIFQTWGYTGSSGTQDVTGGWYDAGDHGKYVVNGGISLWTLQNQYECALFTGNEDCYADGTMNIPENNNGYPDLLDEARWEMEWMNKMLVADGSFKDMVYHKVNDENWTALGMKPSDDTEKRLLYPPTTAATLNVAACAAQAARLWKGIDDTFADTCLDIAKRTYAAAKAHPDMYAPLEGDTHGGGAYGDDDVTDEFYWAACELYISTGDDTYLTDMKASDFYTTLTTTLNGGESKDQFSSLDWGHTSACGTLSLAINKDKISSTVYEAAVKNIKAAADIYLKKEAEQGYGVPYAQGNISATNTNQGYAWGSNGFVVNNSIVMAYAYMLSDEQKYLDGAMDGMSYILGRNPMDNSYVTGYGTHTSIYPHHRFWSNQIDPAFPLAPCGVLTGGPNSGMEDPWVRGSGWKSGAIPPMKCYMDSIEAWSANECTINWNAPLAWMAGFIAQNSNDGIIVGSTGNGNGITLSTDTKNSSEGSSSQSSSGDNKSADADSSDDGESDQQKQTKSSKEKNESGNNKIIMLALILFAVLALVVSGEIFAYKMFKLKAGGNNNGNNGNNNGNNNNNS